jgi:hypothetical protein
MKKILELYQLKYKYNSFYKVATNKILENNLIKNNFDMGFEKSKDSNINYTAKFPDVRIDLPIWFGSPEKAKLKVMILGREPRDSNDKYNLEKNTELNYVFGTPFGIEFWNEENKYYKSFKEIISRQDVLCYFTDVVKKYEVKDTKHFSDASAKENFWLYSEKDIENFTFLNDEINLLNPDIIIGLGNESYTFLKKHFGLTYKIEKVTHPNAWQDKKTGENAWDKAIKQINQILS